MRAYDSNPQPHVIELSVLKGLNVSPTKICLNSIFKDVLKTCLLRRQHCIYTHTRVADWNESELILYAVCVSWKILKIFPVYETSTYEPINWINAPLNWNDMTVLEGEVHNVWKKSERGSHLSIIHSKKNNFSNYREGYMVSFSHRNSHFRDHLTSVSSSKCVPLSLSLQYGRQRRFAVVIGQHNVIHLSELTGCHATHWLIATRSYYNMAANKKIIMTKIQTAQSNQEKMLQYLNLV